MGKKKSGKKKSGKKKGKKGAKEDEAPDPFAGLDLPQVSRPSVVSSSGCVGNRQSLFSLCGGLFGVFRRGMLPRHGRAAYPMEHQAAYPVMRRRAGLCALGAREGG